MHNKQYEVAGTSLYKDLARLIDLTARGHTVLVSYRGELVFKIVPLGAGDVDRTSIHEEIDLPTENKPVTRRTSIPKNPEVPKTTPARASSRAKGVDSKTVEAHPLYQAFREEYLARYGVQADLIGEDVIISTWCREHPNELKALE